MVRFHEKSVRQIDTAPHGPIQLTIQTQGSRFHAILVNGPNIPEVWMGWGIGDRSLTPRLFVAGQQAVTDIRRDPLTRAGARVAAKTAGRRYVWTPINRRQAVVRENERLVLTAVGKPRPDPTARLDWEADADPLDTAI